MKKFLVKVALFFVIVAALDMGYGIVGDYLRDHAKGGVAAKVHYICEECNDNLMMMGSSRMQHHYVPQVFEDSLGMACYNAGMDGNGILLSYGFLKMLLERYDPKMIVYDVSGFDMYGDDNTKYLDFMKPYYWSEHESVAGIFSDVDKMERWKNMSSFYRYNSKLFQMIGDNVHPLSNLDKGYAPLDRTMDYDPPVPSGETRQVDSLKIQYLRKFIALAQENDVNLVFVASPTWHGFSRVADNAPMTLLSEEMGVEFINCYYDSLLCSSHEFWSDATHMNDKGARAFSGELAGKLKCVLTGE